MTLQSISQRTVVPLIAAIAAVGLSASAGFWFRDREATRHEQEIEAAAAKELSAVKSQVDRDAAIVARLSGVENSVHLILARLDILSNDVAAGRRECAAHVAESVSLEAYLADWQIVDALNPDLQIPARKR